MHVAIRELQNCEVYSLCLGRALVVFIEMTRRSVEHDGRKVRVELRSHGVAEDRQFIALVSFHQIAVQLGDVLSAIPHESGMLLGRQRLPVLLAPITTARKFEHRVAVPPPAKIALTRLPKTDILITVSAG